MAKKGKYFKKNTFAAKNEKKSAQNQLFELKSWQEIYKKLYLLVKSKLIYLKSNLIIEPKERREN